MGTTGRWSQLRCPHVDYPSVEAFVRDPLSLTYRQAVDGRDRTRCAQWLRHPEAIIRLRAVVWLRDHADHHSAVLLDPDGPVQGLQH
jgi:hypothetical protein